MTHTGFNTHAGFDETLQTLEQLFKNLLALSGEEDTVVTCGQINGLDALILEKGGQPVLQILYSDIGAGSYCASSSTHSVGSHLNGSETMIDRLAVIRELIELTAPNYAALVTRLDSTGRGQAFAGPKPSGPAL